MRLVQVHATADHLAIVGVDQVMHDLEVGVLQRLGGELGRDLVGDDEPLAERAHLGQHVGEHRHGLRPRVAHLRVAGRLDILEQAVGLLDQREVLELPAPIRGDLALAVLGIFIEHHEEERHHERLLLVVAEVLQLDHARGLEEVLQRDRAARIEQQALVADHQASQAGTEGGAHVLLDFLPVVLPRQDDLDLLVEILEIRRQRARLVERRARIEDVVLRGVEAPPALGVHLQDRLFEDERHPGEHREGGVERGLDQIDVAPERHTGHRAERIQPERQR